MTRTTLTQYAEAWQDGDLTRMFDAYADDVVFHYFGETDLAGDHVGKDAAVEKMIAASTRATRTLVEIIDVLAGDSLGAIVAIERFERDGKSEEVQRVLLYRVDGERIVECWLYDADQPLIDTFWAP
jgi:ketosteroid isomerase-like protein